MPGGSAGRILGCAAGHGLGESTTVSEDVEPLLPFRWDLIAPDNVGTLLDGTPPPDRLWFGEALATCTGRVLARCGDGDLVFVGRSLDSMFDLLGGALEHTDWSDRLRRLPVSFAGTWPRMSAAETRQVRRLLTELGLDPHRLARRGRPVTFVDVVCRGGTFDQLFGVLRPWIEQSREPWSVIRRKLRFIGVTIRQKASPNTFRWQQHTRDRWAASLPARATQSVSLDGWVWSYFGDQQAKTMPSFRSDAWFDGRPGAWRSETAQKALAEAFAVVDFGRSQPTRAMIVRAMSREPALAEPWLRSLVVQLGAARPGR